MNFLCSRLALITCVSLVSGLVIAPSAGAQPAPATEERDPEPLTVDSAARRIADAYRTASVSERLRISVRTSSESAPATERGSTLSLWIDPGREAIPGPIATVQAGRLVFRFTRDTATAYLDRASPPWCEFAPPDAKATPAREDDRTAAGRGSPIPPLPVPQLDILRWNDNGDTPDLTQYARDVRFHSVTEDARAGTFTLRGSDGVGAGAEVELTADLSSGRLRRVTIIRPAPGSASRTTIEILVSPGAGSPPARTLDPARRLATWNDFVREVRSGAPSGAVFDHARLLDLAGRPWSGDGLNGSVLVFVPVSLDGDQDGRLTVSEALATLKAVLEGKPGWTPRLVVAGGAGDDNLNESFLTRIQALLDALRPSADTDGLADTLLCVDPRFAAEYIESESLAAAIVVGPDRVVRRTVQLPRAPAPAADFSAALQAALE